MALDAIIPARNEEPTVAANVAAALGCRYVREVIVVDDGSADHTAEEARSAGAKVVGRADAGWPGPPGVGGSKAHAMAAGVAATDADLLLFLDADCTGLTAEHLDAICAPVVEGRAVMSIGTFDYGPFWNPQVRRWPPLSGERCIPRWVWDAIPASKLAGYTIELRINAVVAERRLPTVVRTMAGVSHRTKRDKHGPLEGIRRTGEMFGDLLRVVWPFGDVRPRAYLHYLRHLTVE